MELDAETGLANLDSRGERRAVRRGRNGRTRIRHRKAVREVEIRTVLDVVEQRTCTFGVVAYVIDRIPADMRNLVGDALCINLRQRAHDSGNDVHTRRRVALGVLLSPFEQ